MPWSASCARHCMAHTSNHFGRFQHLKTTRFSRATNRAGYGVHSDPIKVGSANYINRIESLLMRNAAVLNLFNPPLCLGRTPPWLLYDKLRRHIDTPLLHSGQLTKRLRLTTGFSSAMLIRLSRRTFYHVVTQYYSSILSLVECDG